MSRTVDTSLTTRRAILAGAAAAAPVIAFAGKAMPSDLEALRSQRIRALRELESLDYAIGLIEGALELDPIFAAIEAHRAAMRAHSDAVSLESEREDTPTARKQCKLIDGMEARIKSALEAGEHGDEEDKMFQEIVAKVMEKDGNGFSGTVYPRLVAIDLARWACPELFAERPDDDAALKAARARTAEASDAMDDAAMAFVNVKPTTLAGIAALLSYLAECSDSRHEAVFPSNLEDEDDDGRSFHHLAFRSIAAAVKAIAPPVA
jgi:hypothetical protein